MSAIVDTHLKSRWRNEALTTSQAARRAQTVILNLMKKMNIEYVAQHKRLIQASLR